MSVDLGDTWTFEPALREFDLGNARACARAAYLVYEAPATVMVRLKRWGFTDRTFLDLSGTQAFVASRDDIVLVAFRGTEAKVVDFLTDARANHKDEVLKGVNGRVHGGFHAALKHVWDTVHELVGSAGAGGAHVWFTGHSLGGALAELAACRSVQHDLKIAGVCTFGKPRVGNEAYRAALDAHLGGRLYNLVNDKDIVPHVPPIAFQYSHAGKPFLLRDPNDPAPAAAPAAPAGNRLLGLFEAARAKIEARFAGQIGAIEELVDLSKLTKENFEDHRMASYIDGLDKNLLM